MCVSIFSVDSIIGFRTYSIDINNLAEEKSFKIDYLDAHASFFVVWWAAAMWSMGIIIHLQRLIGQKDTDPYVSILYLCPYATYYMG